MAAVRIDRRELTNEQRGLLDGWLYEFDRGWHQGLLAERMKEIPADSRLRLVALVDLIKIDLERQWREGIPRNIESYLQDYPELGTPETVPAELLHAEYEVRRQFGATATLEEYAQHFPRRVEELRQLIQEAREVVSEAELDQRSRVIAVSSRSTHSVARNPGNTKQVVPPASPSPADTARKSSPLPATMELPAEFGHYRILKKLGQGGMGSVYLAQDTKLERTVAIKVPSFTAKDGPELLERFYREAKAAATLSHPNICSVHEVGEVNGLHYLILAFIEGRSLGEVLDTGKQLDQRKVALVVRKLALAMQEAHQKGIIHRDLKPDNVKLDPRGEPVILDFGLARRVEHDPRTRMTQDGCIMGTPAYMAPEQVRGKQDEIGPACDIYSLGVILYEMLTGVRPFEGSLFVVLRMIDEIEPEPPSKHRPDLDPRLEAICLKAMAKKMENRFSTMKDFAAALTEYLQNRQPTLLPESTPPATQRPTAPAAQLAPASDLPANPWAGIAEDPPGLVTAPIRCNRRQWPGWVKLVVAGVVTLVCLLGVVMYVVTDHGTIKIELSDPAAKVEVKVDGNTVTLQYGDTPLRMKAGKHHLTITGKDFETYSRAFTVKRADNPVLTVELEPKRVAKAEPPPRPREKPPKLEERPPSENTPLTVKTVVEETRRFNGHAGGVGGVAFSPDGRYVLSGSGDKTMRLWEVDTGKEVRAFRHPDWVGTVAFSPDGRQALSGAGDKTIRLWEVETGKELKSFTGHTECIRSVLFSSDGRHVLSASPDWTVRYWEIATARQVHCFQHQNWAYRVALSRAGRLALSGSSDSTARIWDLESGKEVLRFEGHKGGVWGVAFSPDDSQVLSASLDKTMYLWETRTGSQVRSFEPHSTCVMDLAMSPDGRRALTASGAKLVPTGWWSAGHDYCLHLWHLESGRQVCRFEGHGDVVLSVAFSPDGRYAASGSADTSVRLWRLPQPEIANSIGMRLAWIPAGEFLMGAEQGEEGSQGDERPQHRVRITRPFFLGVAEVTQEQYAKVIGRNPSWFAASGGGKDKVESMDTNRFPVEQVSWEDAVEFCRRLTDSPAEKVAGRVYRLPTEAEWEYACRAGTRTAFHFGDDPARLGEHAWYGANSDGKTHPVGQKGPNAWGLYDMYGSLWEWCADYYDPDHYRSSPQSDPQGPAQGGQRVLRGGYWGDAGSYCRSAERGMGGGMNHGDSRRGFRLVCELKSPGADKERPQATSSSPSDAMPGKDLFDKPGTKPSGEPMPQQPVEKPEPNASGKARLKTNVPVGGVRLFKGHTGPGTSVALSLSTCQAISGSADCTARVWDLATGKELGRFERHSQAVAVVALSPDGKRALSGCLDALILWDVTTRKEILRLGIRGRGSIDMAMSIEPRPLIPWVNNTWGRTSSSPSGTRIAPSQRALTVAPALGRIAMVAYTCPCRGMA